MLHVIHDFPELVVAHLKGKDRASLRLVCKAMRLWVDQETTLLLLKSWNPFAAIDCHKFCSRFPQIVGLKVNLSNFCYDNQLTDALAQHCKHLKVLLLVIKAPRWDHPECTKCDQELQPRLPGSPLDKPVFTRYGALPSV